MPHGIHTIDINISKISHDTHTVHVNIYKIPNEIHTIYAMLDKSQPILLKTSNTFDQSTFDKMDVACDMIGIYCATFCATICIIFVCGEWVSR